MTAGFWYSSRSRGENRVRTHRFCSRARGFRTPQAVALASRETLVRTHLFVVWGKPGRQISARIRVPRNVALAAVVRRLGKPQGVVVDLDRNGAGLVVSTVKVMAGFTHLVPPTRIDTSVPSAIPGPLMSVHTPSSANAD